MVPSSRSRALHGVLLLCGLLAAGCATQPAQGPAVAAFGTPQTLDLGKELRFEDGLEVALERIDDSRCPADVQCVWAGELAAVLRLRGGALGAAPQALTLGTTRAREASVGSYRFTLSDATTTSVTLIVSRLGAPSS